MPSVTVGVTVAGVDGAHSSCGCLPPDTNGAAGPTNVIEVVNTAMDIFNKSGTLLSGPTSLPTFFSGHGFTVNSLSDPVVVFDDSIVNSSGPNGRFIIAILDFTSTNATDFLDFAISNNADATAGFTNFRHVNVGETSFFADQPRLGVNADAYFVQFNMFATAGGFYDHPQLFTVQKSNFLTGGLTTFHHDLAGGNTIASVDPAIMHGAAAGGPEYLVSEGVNFGQINVVTETNVLSNTPTDVTTTFNVTTYTSPPNAPQPSGSVTTNDSRMLNAAWRDNILVSTQTVGDGSPTTAHARWYQFDTSTAPTLKQSGDINPGAGIATYFPSIDINASDTIGMTYIESSTSEFVSMYVTGRTISDATGTMETGVRTQAGTTNYSGSRMGDYSGTSIDPADGATFWSENEWINNSGAGSWATGIASFTLSSSTAATHVVFGVQPSNTVAGQAITPAVTVKVEDASNNVVTGDNTDKVTLAIGTNAGGGTLSGTLTLTVQNGVATFSNLSINKSGTGYTLTASATGLTGATSSSFNITAGSPSALAFTTAAQTITAGQHSGVITVELLDSNGNVATAGSGGVVVSLSSTSSAGKFLDTSGNPLATPSVTIAQGGSTASFEYGDTLAGTPTLTAAAPTFSATQQETVRPAAASTLVVSGFPSPVTAGTQESLTVTADDAFGNVATGYLGTVHFTSSDGQALLPANYMFVSGDAGVKTFASVILKTAGAQSITATDTVTASITGSETMIQVNPASAFRYTLTAPSSTTAGTAFSITVTAVDAYNNTATGYTGTAHFTSTDGKAVLPVDYTFTVGAGMDNGVHTFTNGVTLKTAGTQSVTATDTATSSITASASIKVAAAAARTLTISAPATARVHKNFSFTVTMLDAFGNVATGYTGTITFTSTDARAKLPSNFTFTAGDAGVHTFHATLNTAGTQTITATDTVDSTITGTSSGILVALLTPEDLMRERLIDPDAPDGILDAPDDGSVDGAAILLASAAGDGADSE